MSEFTFKSPFNECYRRNRNSRTRTKNLRCFPCCSIQGQHNEIGFCGQSVQVKAPASSLNVPLDTIVAYAQFGMKSKTLRDLPTAEVTRDQLRGVHNPCGNWIPVVCERQADNGVSFIINPSLLGWHYGWKSNKNARKIKHVLRLLVFAKGARGALTLACQVSAASLRYD